MNYICLNFLVEMLVRLLFIFAVIFSVEAFNWEKELLKCSQTLEMFDASGKLPSGILSGNWIELGHFDQCLSDEENEQSKESKYCIMKVALPKELTEPTTRSLYNAFGKNFLQFASKNSSSIEERMAIQGLDPIDGSKGLMLGWCLPRTCNIYILSYILTKAVRKIDSDMKVIPVLGGALCQTSDSLIIKYDTNSIIFITFLCATAFLMISSTIYDAYIRHHKRKPAHIILTAFSVKTNGSKLLKVNNHPDQLPCLNGIRVLSMMWVVYGHRVSAAIAEPIINLNAFSADFPTDPGNMYVLSAGVSVDTFFILSGLLVGYGYCRAMDKGVKFNIILYYIHRYLRLTPVLAVVIWFHVTILGYFGSGPFWPFISMSFGKICKDNWWPTLLYIQNYYIGREMCLSQSWYLAVDMQLFILSPIILIPLWRWPKQTIIASAILVLGSMAGSFAISYAYDLSGFTSNRDTVDYMEKYYYATHFRFGPWLMGLMLGYYLFTVKKNNNKISLHPATVILGWIAALGLMLSVIFAAHSLLLNPDKLSEYFYNALSRHGWALGVCWLIYACTQGYGGPINSFLSWPLFQIAGRFTYAIYLIHYTFQNAMSSASKTNSYLTDFRMMYVFWGDFMVSLIIAVGLTLAYESPMVTIEKVLFKTGRNPKKPELPVLDNSTAKIGRTNQNFENDK